jgi:hypothetical protein
MEQVILEMNENRENAIEQRGRTKKLKGKRPSCPSRPLPGYP